MFNDRIEPARYTFSLIKSIEGRGNALRPVFFDIGMDGTLIKLASGHPETPGKPFGGIEQWVGY